MNIACCDARFPCSGYTCATSRPRAPVCSFRKCDKICVVHAGKVVEEGAHEELMLAPGGRYKALVNSAAGGKAGDGLSSS